MVFQRQIGPGVDDFRIGVSFLPNGINGDPSVAGGPTTFAVRSDGVFGDWDGGIDEVAVYNYVLNPQQILNHFQNTTRLSIVKSGSNVIVTWPVGALQSSTNVSGPYAPVESATSPYTNAALSRDLLSRQDSVQTGRK